MLAKLADTVMPRLCRPPEGETRKAVVTAPFGVAKQLFKMSLWPFKPSSKDSREHIAAMRWCCAVPVGSFARALTRSRDIDSTA
jgi:hypothetical protein